MQENLQIDYNEMVRRIQRVWRSFIHRKIFRYFIDLLFNRLKNVNPWKILKVMEPAECKLIESCTNMHVRFRLGGLSFPPQVYYKVYTNGNVTDINSFAPRNYAEIKEKYPKLTLNQYRKLSKKNPLDGWYKRVENNGWKPLDTKINKGKIIELYSGLREKYYHHDKKKRDLKNKKFHKLNKLRWLQSMYKRGKLKEGDQQPNDVDEIAQILDGENFLMNDDPEAEKEAEDLIKWGEELDFDKYIDDWFFKSTVFVNFEGGNN